MEEYNFLKRKHICFCLCMNYNRALQLLGHLKIFVLWLRMQLYLVLISCGLNGLKRRLRYPTSLELEDGPLCMKKIWRRSVDLDLHYIKESVNRYKNECFIFNFKRGELGKPGKRGKRGFWVTILPFKDGGQYYAVCGYD